MRVVDVIEAKKLGKEHSKEEIEFLIDSLMNGTATDYQLAAWLMAVYFKGMTDLETSFLTEAMIKSGEIVDYNKPFFKTWKNIMNQISHYLNLLKENYDNKNYKQKVIILKNIY